MRFADIRTEWRVDDIERSLRNKAENYELSSVSSDVDCLERTVRDLRAEVAGLCAEFQRCQDKITDMENIIETFNRQ